MKIPRTSRVTFLEPIKGGGQKGALRLAKVMLALLVLLLLIDFDYPVGLPSGAEFDTGENAVWIALRWSSMLIPSEERTELAKKLRGHGVRWVYADQGSVRPNGTVPKANALYAGGLVADFHRAYDDMQVLAWIRVQNSAGGDGTVSLADRAVRKQIAEECKRFVEQLGFDGVILDIEPAPSGDPNYLDLLAEVRVAIGNKTLSVAGMKLTPVAPRLDTFQFLPYSWEADYYKEIGRRTDQVVLVGYDSALPFANLYIKYLSWQTSNLLVTLRNMPARILIGVPTYSDERWNFHPRAENIGSGLQGVVESLKDLRRNGDFPDNFAGVAIFGEWSTSDEEWQLYEKVWRNKGLGMVECATPLVECGMSP